jgi:hypothetical protein
MSQAKSADITSPAAAVPTGGGSSRRALLTAAPAVAAGALLAGTAVNAVAIGMAKAGEADPIVALIEAYDQAASRELVLYREADRLEEALPKEQRTWSVHFGCGRDGRWPPEGCTDAPEWLNAQLAIGEASDRMSDLMFALLTTAPTNIEGAVALLERLDAAAFREEQDHDEAEALIAVMSDWYDERVAEAAAEFHSTLAVALRNIIARGLA